MQFQRENSDIAIDKNSKTFENPVDILILGRWVYYGPITKKYLQRIYIKNNEINSNMYIFTY